MKRKIKKKRIEFEKQTKDIISARSAYRCSFPGCNATLIGPGLEPASVDIIGECAHIYAAGKKGPRCNHTLSEDDLKKPENGIYLCRTHHALIDKNKGKDYPAETLMLFKQMHEHKISEEIGHISYPLLWIKRITVEESDLLKNGVVYDFTKSTIIIGNNGTGKSIMMEYIYTALTGECGIRLNKSRVVLTIELSNPVWQKVKCVIDNGSVKYKIGGNEITFCPFTIDVVFIRDCDKTANGDLINWIMIQLQRDRQFVKNLIDGADLSESNIVSKVWMETVRTKPYEYIRIRLLKKSDDDFNNHWALEQFSGTEKYSVVFDLVLGYMKNLSRYKNTLFLVDWSYVNNFDNKLKNHYFHIFHNSCNYFQTVVAMHTLWEEVDWSGWNMIKMTKEGNLDIKI